MNKQILVIHEFSVIRHIIQNYILTEHTQSIVDTSENYQDGVDMLKKKKYDIIISGLEMDSNGMSGFSIKNSILTSVNKKTPLIILTTNYDSNQNDKLSNEFKHILSIPFTDLELRNMIFQIIDSRKDRVYNRYAIPNTKALVKIQGHDLEADVINISKNGIFCELTITLDSINLLVSPVITLLFPSEYGQIKVRNISCRVLRFTSKTWGTNHFPKKIRIVWKFIDISKQSESVLERVLEKAYNNLKEAEKKVLETSSIMYMNE